MNKRTSPRLAEIQSSSDDRPAIIGKPDSSPDLDNRFSPKANEIINGMSKPDMSMLMIMQFLRDQRMQELQKCMSKRDEF